MEPTNEDRAKWAQEALDVFAKRVFHNPADREAPEAIQDLICNLLHLAQQRGFDPAQLLDNAKDCYEEEAEEQATHECDACGEHWRDDQLQEIKDYHQRVDPGGTVPSGECPECGCLCYPAENE